MADMTDAKAKSLAYKIRRAYTLAQANKGEDRITQKDVKMAEKAIKGMDILSASQRDRAKVNKASKYDELPKGLRKDTTTGFGANITVEGKSMGGEIEVGKGGDYIKDLID